jgi:nucleotide-binding universal stress UspA family protein
MAYQRILVPVDGSATSRRGLKEAIVLAKAVKGRIIVLHVVEAAPLIAAPEAAAYMPDLIDDLRASGQKVAKAAKTQVDKSGVPSEVVVVETAGKAIYQVIVDQAKRLRANIIVIGTHGRRGIARVVMGSDAEGVVREAKLPVMLVRG